MRWPVVPALSDAVSRYGLSGGYLSSKRPGLKVSFSMGGFIEFGLGTAEIMLCRQTVVALASSLSPARHR
jgi:hypothetical protein